MRKANSDFLVHAPFGYCFRLRIPDDIQNRISKQEIRRTLKTRSRRTAKQLSRFIASQIQLLFDDLRNGAMPELTASQINQIIKGYISEALMHSEQLSASRKAPVGKLESGAEWIRKEAERRQLQDYLVACNYDHIKSELDAVLTTGDIVVERDTGQYQSMLRSMLKARIDIISIDIKRDEGNYSAPGCTQR